MKIINAKEDEKKYMLAGLYLTNKFYICIYIPICYFMNFEQLCFTTFCVGSLADALKMSAGKVYGMLRSSGILTEYLLPGYEVLHTFSKEYIVDDLISYMKEKGVLE